MGQIKVRVAKTAESQFTASFIKDAQVVFIECPKISVLYNEVRKELGHGFDWVPVSSKVVSRFRLAAMAVWDLIAA